MTTHAPLHGEALYRALETPSPFTVWRLGGAGIAVRTPQSLLYIDPFLDEGGGEGWIRQHPQIIHELPPADVVLATHEHGDHADPVALAQQARNGSALFGGLNSCVQIARDAGFPPQRTCTLQPDETFRHADLTVTAVKAVDFEIEDELAYLVHDEATGITLYHGGDSSMSPQFATVGSTHQIDICCLSVGTVSDGYQYYLSPEEAIESARMLEARILIPLHWDLWTRNSVPESAWQSLLNATSSPQIVLLPPGGGWQPA